jgi:hypothetical protein
MSQCFPSNSVAARKALERRTGDSNSRLWSCAVVLVVDVRWAASPIPPPCQVLHGIMGENGEGTRPPEY